MDDDTYDDGGNDSHDRIISELENIHSTLKSKANFSQLFWGVLIIAFFAGWPGSGLDRWTDKVWYSMRYGCAAKDVTVEKRPSDCDWLHAPVGDKGCHYKKSVNAFGAKERSQLRGQALTLEEQRQYEQMPNSATVSWEKESE